MLSRLVSVPLALLLTLSPALASPFTARAKANLPNWDKNHDGRLSAREIDEAMTDPTVQGDDAACLATLKEHTRLKAKVPVRWSETVIEDLEGGNAIGGQPLTTFDRQFRYHQTRLNKAQRVLFAPGAPQRQDIRQNHNGDCYLLSALGAMLEFHPEQVRQLVQANPDGTFTVTFPSHRARPKRGTVPRGPWTFRLPAPTDTEIAAFNSCPEEGFWLNLVEKAFGMVRIQQKPAELGSFAPEEVSGSGGSGVFAIYVLTGKLSNKIRFPSQPSARQLGDLRRRLQIATREQRMMTTWTGKAEVKRPRGIVPRHVMAVLRYHDDTDLVELWNPWGNTLNPKSDNPMDGYPTEHGVFSLPLEDFVRYFAGVSIEA